MILLYGKNPVANVLHLITGPETDFWTQLHGAAAVDLTSVLALMDQSQPVFLHVTRCNDERETAAQLQTLMNNGSEYPFVPPTYVFTPVSANDNAQNAGAPIVGSPFPGQAPVSGPEQPITPNPPKAKQKKANEPGMKTGTCMRCRTKDVQLVPKLTPGICYSCVQIDLHMAQQVDKMKNNTGDDKPPADKKE